MPKQTLVRTYVGSQEQAASRFERDAAQLATQGYFPVSQTYSPGTYGCGAFLLALVLCVVLIGILIFIYMLIVKPPGTLSVTYAYRTPDRVKICPSCAETVKAGAIKCRFCDHEFDPATVQPRTPIPQVDAGHRSGAYELGRAFRRLIGTRKA